ncbi:MAG: acyl-CoA dehydrogenase [Actinomycetota bacterium]|nr:acyl-CoA dehydrogenase [Actinomycetota bacterium]
MGHYRSNLRDVEFNLFELFATHDHYGRGPFAPMDLGTARQVLREVERLASGEFADAFVEGDRVPLALSNGEVTVPAGINRALDAYFGGEWHRLQLPDHLGGYGAPPSLSWACSAMLAGGNAAALMYTAGPFFATIADRLVTDEQRQRWVVPMVERHWGGTMVLTEPDAGSDVGAGRTTAIDAGDGTWHLAGIKRFITNGDFDWPENIVHLVLARPVGPDGLALNGPGTKGLSLYIVPKYWVDADGSLQGRNGAVVTKVEDKMGLKASSTCELTLGEHRPARGVLVGDVHDGIRQMFRVIEYARMLVGTKAMETLSTGYLNALDYARQRVQGADLASAADKTAPRVAIIRHPDVRRMLLEQKAHAEGLRALIFFTASIQDRIRLAEADVGDDDTGLQELAKLNDLLLPLVKGYASEKSYELLAQSLQVLGGSGYCRDYPVEQYLRDAKIDTLYEGTTGIQGMDLFFRKIGRDQGAALAGLLAQIQDLAKGDAGNGELARERALLADALGEVQQMLAAMVGNLSEEGGLYRVGLNTTPFLMSLSELVVGWLLLRSAEVALDALKRAQDPADAAALPDADRAFYEGKVAAARWFAATVLPHLAARRAVLVATDLTVMALDDAAF